MNGYIAIIKRKGLMESAVHAMNVGLGRIISYLKVLWLRIRGYRLHWNITISGGNRFFQSHKGHIRVGNGSRFGSNTRLDAGYGGFIDIGNDALIDDNCYISAQDRITIGDHTMIAAYSFITDFNHGFSQRNLPMNAQKCETKPVRIGDDVWIGAHVVILPGVTIGKGSIIGAGSVITKSLKSYSVAVGNPAKVIRYRP